ncbi:hypothetical protein BGC33_05890 [Bathymodiolus thermophilus thioautotrophic gill symbiont]|uniref:Uncharacterized protein n=1 Tax=Bathymodiolus thermophilus thioautotrophic gill symbiont TaxID=2360 RepID=A0A1J5TWM4_9GAMM|nr:hypothetical protein BGC33_05890 [Bathymodiolus thermophilus thioautotrophic gill symbiont]
MGEVGKFIGGGTPLIKIKEYWGGNIPWAFTIIIENLDNTVYGYHLIRFRSEKDLDIDFLWRVCI